MADQRFGSFADVDRLGAKELTALLTGGEPPERVWAAWALGLRHHEGFARDLRATAAEEPDPGVRRHLLVILAGAGESRSVLTLAGHDPDERVRATALQYLARLARPDDDETNALLVRTLAEGPPLLQLGCVAGLRPDARPALWRAAEDCINSLDRDLRWTAFEAVLRHGAAQRTAPELVRLFLNLEPEVATRQDAVRVFCEHAGAGALRALAADPTLERRLLPELVEVLHEQRQQLTWPEVRRLLDRDETDTTRLRSLQLLTPGAEGTARAGLLQLYIEDQPMDGRLAAETLKRLRAALDQNQAPLDAAERRLRDALARHVEQTVAAARTDPDFFEDSDVDPRADLPPGQVLDPIALDWFCPDERDILARLAPLDVH
jgi:hypothetical protein